MEAHLVHWQVMHELGLVAAFFGEADRHPREPAWDRMRAHLEMTIGSRQFDHWATEGKTAYETAMARSLAKAVRRGLTHGWSLAFRYGWNACWALFSPKK